MNKRFLGLRTAIYKVTDLDKAKAWYAKVLGFPPYFDEPFYVGFNVGGYELGLLPLTNATATVPAGVTAYWGVADVQKTFDELIAAGATAAESPHDVGGDIIVASVIDPWGNSFGIIYNPGFQIE